MKSIVIKLLPLLIALQFAWASGGPSCETATVVTTVPFREEGLLDVYNGPTCAGEPANDVFYSFVAPSTDTYRFSLTGSTNSDRYRMRLWTDGSCCSGNSLLIEVGSIDGTPGHPLALTQGQTVVIEIGVAGLEQVNLIAYTFQIFRLPNYADICPGVEITELPFSHFQSASGIQNEVNLCGTTQSGPDQFFRVQFNETKRCIVSSCLAGTENTIIEIVQSVDGTCFNSFNVACSDDECGTEARLTYTFLANTVYYIVLDHRSPAANFMYLLVEEDRDNCPGREIENIPFYITGNTDFSNNTFTGCEFADNHDDIYRFIPESTALLDVSTCGSSFNTALQIYASPDGTCSNLVALACNDNTCGLQSKLTYQFIADSTYFIVVDGVGYEHGNYQLSLTRPNDECSNAQPIFFFADPITINGSTVGMNNSIQGCETGAGQDVFYYLHLDHATLLGFKVSSPTFSPFVRLYTGLCEQLTPLEFSPAPACGSSDLQIVWAAGDYVVVVDDTSGQSGNFTLTFTELAHCPGYRIPSLPYTVTAVTSDAYNSDQCGSYYGAAFFTLPSNAWGYYRFSLCDSPQHKISLIDGSGPVNACDGPVIACPNALCPDGSLVAFMQLNRPHTVMVRYRPQGSNIFTLRIEPADLPCANEEIVNLPYSGAANLTASPGAGATCGVGYASERVFDFSPDSTVVAQVSLCSVSYLGVLALYEISSQTCVNPIPLTCSYGNCGNGSRQVFQFQQGSRYYIVADRRDTNLPSFGSIAVTPCVPSDLIADSLVILPSGNDVVLSWTEANCSPLEYHVHRASLPDAAPSPANLIATTLATSYTDSNAIALPSDRHFYVVTTSLID